MKTGRIYTAFDRIHADDALKQKTSNFLAAELRTRSHSHTMSVRRIAAFAPCFVLLLAGGGGYFTWLMPVSAISVDINPSLELRLNRLDQVVSVTGYNEDGQQLADSVEVIFLNYQDALDEILESEQAEQYLNGDDAVYITVSGNNENHCQKLLSAIEDCTADGQAGQQVYCSAASGEEADAAREAGLTVGKYRAYLELQQLDPSVSAEEVSEWTMREIRDRLEELSGSETQSDSHGAGSGKQDGTGSGVKNQNGSGQGKGNSSGRGTGKNGGQG